ncbi:MAG TPA: DUF6328 family protein [Actinomycetota bacterium]
MADEDEKERLNRKLTELLNELRVALPGVQVLFAFLLILPFNSRFVDTSDLERAIYAVSLCAAAVASALFIAATAYHRHRFARLEKETLEDKKEMIGAQDHFAIGGLLFLAVAMGGAVFVVFDLLFGVLAATTLTTGLMLVFAWFWYALPLSRRHRSQPASRP